MKQNDTSTQSGHISVLLHEAIDGMNIHKGDVVIDATLGGGGHSAEIVKEFGNTIHLIGLDEDADALTRVADRVTGGNTDFIVANFKDIDTALAGVKVEKVDRILADLGVSSFQIDVSGRGFTFQKDEPLLMTLAKEVTADTVTASKIVNTWSEETIADIIYAYSDERYARRIAKAIIEYRKVHAIATTKELADIITKAVPATYRHGKIHPATRTFQALRIAVNQELENLKILLEKGITLLNKGGRIAIISFHSMEDRIAKDYFRKWEDNGIGVRITKKPITPSQVEIKNNPRSRSAKLRIFEKQ